MTIQTGKRYYLLLLIILFSVYPLSSEVYIKRIYLDRLNVFDSTQTDWFFAAQLANALHVVTRSYLIEDELLFNTDDTLNYSMIYESERNLRNSGLFTEVSIRVDTLTDDLCNIEIATRDRWSTNPSFLFGTGGNSKTIGGRLEELNLTGTGTKVTLEALYRTENNTRWQGLAGIYQPRLFRTEFSLEGSLMANKFRTEQSLLLLKPFRTLETISSYGISAFNSFGDDFLFYRSDSSAFMPFHNRSMNLWYSHAWLRNDRVFITALLELEDISRGKEEYLRAFDNSGKFLLAFSSVSEEYIKTSKLNNYQDEDLCIGGWGTAILGKTFSTGPKGENFYYVAAQGEKSYLFGNLYLIGQLTGSSAFASSNAHYTYEEFSGTGFFRIAEWVIAAARVRQQTVWNWGRLRQLILDNETGLRGYEVNNLSGDNRIISNLEFRFFPDLTLWILKLGGTIFYDAGTVWNQQVEIMRTKWHHSAGFGFRIQNMKATGPNSLFRIDLAYNFDEKRFGEIIFTTDQLFPAFRRHIFKLPEIMGLEFDYE